LKKKRDVLPKKVEGVQLGDMERKLAVITGR
jgi:hypothetical protein